MIQVGTYVKVTDLSGVLFVECIKILKGSSHPYGTIGDYIVGVVKYARTESNYKEGSIIKALIVRVAKPYKRFDGNYISFSENSVILLDNQYTPISTRIGGPILLENRQWTQVKALSISTVIF